MGEKRVIRIERGVVYRNGVSTIFHQYCRNVVTIMLFTQQVFNLQLLIFYQLLSILDNVIILNQISAWSCLHYCCLKKKHKTLFCRLLNIGNNFRSRVYFCLYPVFNWDVLLKKNAVKGGGFGKKHKGEGLTIQEVPIEGGFKASILWS